MGTCISKPLICSASDMQVLSSSTLLTIMGPVGESFSLDPNTFTGLELTNQGAIRYTSGGPAGHGATGDQSSHPPRTHAQPLSQTGKHGLLEESFIIWTWSTSNSFPVTNDDNYEDRASVSFCQHWVELAEGAVLETEVVAPWITPCQAKALISPINVMGLCSGDHPPRTISSSGIWHPMRFPSWEHVGQHCWVAIAYGVDHCASCSQPSPQSQGLHIPCKCFNLHNS